MTISAFIILFLIMAVCILALFVMVKSWSATPRERAELRKGLREARRQGLL